jgi:hypothetical protein
MRETDGLNMNIGVYVDDLLISAKDHETFIKARQEVETSIKALEKFIGLCLKVLDNLRTS